MWHTLYCAVVLSWIMFRSLQVVKYIYILSYVICIVLLNAPKFMLQLSPQKLFFMISCILLIHKRWLVKTSDVSPVTDWTPNKFTFTIQWLEVVNNKKHHVNIFSIWCTNCYSYKSKSFSSFWFLRLT